MVKEGLARTTPDRPWPLWAAKDRPRAGTGLERCPASFPRRRIAHGWRSQDITFDHAAGGAAGAGRRGYLEADGQAAAWSLWRHRHVGFLADLWRRLGLSRAAGRVQAQPGRMQQGLRRQRLRGQGDAQGQLRRAGDQRGAQRLLPGSGPRPGHRHLGPPWNSARPVAPATAPFTRISVPAIPEPVSNRHPTARAVPSCAGPPFYFPPPAYASQAMLRPPPPPAR